jgi:hypothetical protein
MKISMTSGARKGQFLALLPNPEPAPDAPAVRFILERVNVSPSLARTIAVLAQLGGPQ